uniref:Uncharacterized protein n=1 Tax=Lotus japonicus TaxID=34305 RepID=I3T3T5_LOTJA|nr:unknown [Lotus japonicus]
MITFSSSIILLKQTHEGNMHHHLPNLLLSSLLSQSATISSTKTHSTIGQIKLNPQILLMKIPYNVTGRTQFIRVPNPNAVDPTSHVSKHPLFWNHNLHPLFKFKHHLPYQPSDLNRISTVETHVSYPTVHVPLLHPVVGSLWGETL